MNLNRKLFQNVHRTNLYEGTFTYAFPCTYIINSLQEQTMTKLFTIVLLTLGFAALAQSFCSKEKVCIKCTSLFGCYTCCNDDNSDCIDCDSGSGLCTYECCEKRLGNCPNDGIVAIPAK